MNLDIVWVHKKTVSYARVYKIKVKLFSINRLCDHDVTKQKRNKLQD